MSTRTLETLLGSEIRAEVLSFLITHPGETFYIRQLAQLLGRSPTPIVRDLIKLQNMGLVKVEAKGHSKFYGIDTQSHIYPELHSLVIKTTALGDRLRQAFQDLQSIRFAFVYGSFASNDAGPASDIDVFLIGKLRVNQLLSAIRHIEQQLGRAVQYSIFGEAEFLKKLRAKNDFLAQVVAGPKIMIVGSEDEFGRFAQKGMD